MTSLEDLKNKKSKICVVGLGYVGLPLVLSLAKHFEVLGFDIKKQRVEELKKGYDRTREVDKESLSSTSASFTDEPSKIAQCGFVIIAVPTPVKDISVPDMSLVEKASETVGKFLAKGSIVVYESTVFPGATEEICQPILEKNSGLEAGRDFKIGYSPERVNPGDKEHVIEKVVKVVSGMDQEALELIAGVYGAITRVFKAKSIKVAEAAKVIENTQRDLNIALMNELAKIFSKMNIGVYDVLEAAGTKWNFLKFTPGLVGGHCIGVDPYYLTYKAQSLGYQPEVILSGRKINDSMGSWIAMAVLKLLSDKGITHPKVLIAGITFKENVPDIRNSKAVDIYQELVKREVFPEVFDPVADKDEVEAEYGIKLLESPKAAVYDAIFLAVSHQEFKASPFSFWQAHLKPAGILADIKGIYHSDRAAESSGQYWVL